MAQHRCGAGSRQGRDSAQVNTRPPVVVGQHLARRVAITWRLRVLKCLAVDDVVRARRDVQGYRHAYSAGLWSASEEVTVHVSTIAISFPSEFACHTSPRTIV